MPDTKSACLLVRVAAKDMALFRFLLESYENCAYATTLEKRPGLLKLVFAPQQRSVVEAMLKDMARSLPFEWTEWPLTNNN